MMSDDGGIGRLKRRLSAFPGAAEKALRVAMEKSADEIVAAARAFCPVDSGDLRASIGWTWGTAPTGSMVLRKVESGNLSLTIFAGNDVAFYARWVEFGTQGSLAGARVPDGRRGGGYTRKSYRTHPGTPAQPFFYPAYRLNKKRAANRIKRAIRKAVRDIWGKR